MKILRFVLTIALNPLAITANRSTLYSSKDIFAELEQFLIQGLGNVFHRMNVPNVSPVFQETPITLHMMDYATISLMNAPTFSPKTASRIHLLFILSHLINVQMEGYPHVWIKQ